MSAGSPPVGRRYLVTTVEVEGREETRVVELPEFELPPWDERARLACVGKPVPRVDALQKVTGRAVYTADIVRPGMLFAVLVRARIARGRVLAIHLDEARRCPGVVDVMDASDLAALPKPIRAGGVALFDREIHYFGQPLAAVCARSLAAARLAASLVRIEYESMQPVVEVRQARAPGAPVVRGERNLAKWSPLEFSRGDVQRGFQEAEVVVRATYRTASALHCALEPHGAVAEWDGDRLTIWESTQGVFRVRDEVARALGIPCASVRVLMEYMGGGFGAKNSAGAHTFVAALLARRTGRPVRCVLDREGEQQDTGHRPATRIEVTLGARRDGRLTAIAAEAEIAMGIAGWDASPTRIFHQLYSCPHVRTREHFVHLNTQAMAAFRAPGHTEGAFALERAMDRLARELDLDPLELRLRNAPLRDEERDRPYSAGSLRRCLEEGARRFGWEPRPRAPHRPLRGRVRGCGVAAQVWPTGGGPPAYATVRLQPDGSVEVLTGTQDLGTGARTILGQVAADALGTTFDKVRVVIGDTERTPYTGNSWGSMTTASVAPAVRMAAEAARFKLLEAAAPMLGTEPSQLEVSDGFVRRRDCQGQLSIAEVCRRLGQVTIAGEGSRGPNPSDVRIMTFGAQFAEVEVDTDTGQLQVLRLVAVHDCGRVINPLLARSQLEGGILQGLGLALFEERLLDHRTGKPLQRGLHDYKVPTMADTPAIEAVLLDSVDPVANNVGARGLAEPPIIPTAPAIANAVADALGVEPDALPLAPWRVLDWLQRKREGQSSAT